MALEIVLAVLAIAAAIFGFELIASTATLTSVALVLFWVFLGLFVLGLLYRLLSGHWVYGSRG